MSKSEQVQQATTNGAHDIMLIDFLREHDAACPVCRYNLRGLTRPVCPECQHDLVLTVGAPRLRLGWLLAALPLGFFSGIAACFLCIPTVAIYFEDGVLVLPFVGGILFGWCSGLFALILVVKRNRFIAQPRNRQRAFVLVIWSIHFVALVLFFLGFAAVI